MLEKIKFKFKEWKRKREWNAERQLYYLRVIVQADNRWLAHDPTASALTNRYLNLLSDHWESEQVEDIQYFRERIELVPHSYN